jgi:WD40 repeat protein
LRVHLLESFSKLYCFSPVGACCDPNERRIRNLITVSRIFLSHSSQDNPQAIALRDWSKSEGWDDIFLDNDPENGIHVGDRWELALSEAIAGCEAVLFLFSKNWLGSTWCLRELRSAHEHNKRLFGVLIEPLPRASLPEEVTTTWQTISLVPTDDAETFSIRMPRNGEIVQVPFSARGLRGLRMGLRKAGLDPSFFQWPPPNELDRPPYRGLRPLEAEDAGIFFGRDSAIISALDTLRGLRRQASPRIVVILGASGAGKSSFLRAGLLPRLRREDENFLTLPIVRPERAVLTGDTGLVNCLASAAAAAGIEVERQELDRMVASDPAAVASILANIVAATRGTGSAPQSRAPSVILPIDQGEELFDAYSADEATAFFRLIRAILDSDRCDLIVIFTIRTDKYEPLQAAKAPADPLNDLAHCTISLPPISKGLYASIIEGPAERLRATARPLTIEPALTQALLDDIGSGDDKDALPLLAFTLDRLYRVYGADGDLRLAEYTAAGRIGGAIEAAVEEALERAATLPGVPVDRTQMLNALRDGFIPWLARIDLETLAPRRRQALRSEIPPHAATIIECMIEQRLLSADRVHDGNGVPTGELTIEPAHEALLRQWTLLRDWLRDDESALRILESIRRAATEWKAPEETGQVRLSPDALLVHRGTRLLEAERVLIRPDFTRAAGTDTVAYVVACRQAENAANAAAAEQLEQQRRQIKRTQRAQRRGFMFLGAATLAVLLGIIGVLTVVQRLNQRSSNTLAATAQQASTDGWSDRAARYALAGMVGRDQWFVGFDPSRAEEALRIERYGSPARAALLGHARSVRGALFNHDGTRIVTGSYDRTARIWDVTTGAALHMLTGHQGKIERIALSSDDRRIATASFDGTAKIWDAGSGALVHSLPHLDTNGRPAQVWGVAFSPDGKLLATGASDRVARIWDVATGQQVHVLAPVHRNEVHEVAFARDGQKLLSTSEDGAVCVWDVGSGELLFSLSADDDGKGGHTMADFTPDGRLIVTAATSGVLRVWNASTGALVRTLDDSHKSQIQSIGFDAEGRRMVTASSDKFAQIWDLRLLKRTYQLSGHESSVRQAAFSPDGRRVVTVSDDTTARLWDVETGKALFVFRGHEEAVWTANFAPDGHLFVTSSHDGTARVWDADFGVGVTDQVADAVILRSDSQMRAAAFSPDGRFVATGSYDKPDLTARVWDAVTGRLLAVLPVGDKVQAIAFSPDGERVATGSVDKFLAQVWAWRRCDPTGAANCEDGTPMRHGHFVKAIAFSPDGKELLTGSRDHLARIWDLAHRREPRITFPPPESGWIHPSGVNAAAYSPDGRFVLTGSYDDAWIWDAASGASICELKGHTDAIRYGAFSSDGRRAVTASEDSTARLWDPATCAETGVLTAGNDSIWSASFSPDGKHVVLASEKNRSARIFETATAKQVGVLRGHDAAVYAAAYSPVDNRRILTASADKTARVWKVPEFVLPRGDALVRDVCTNRLAAGLSILTDRELAATPVLDPEQDRNPCQQSSLWRRLIPWRDKTR